MGSPCARRKRSMEDAWQTWMAAPRRSPALIEANALTARDTLMKALEAAIRWWHEVALRRRIERSVATSTAMLVWLRWWKWSAARAAGYQRLDTFAVRVWYVWSTRHVVRRWRASAAVSASLFWGGARTRVIGIAFDRWLADVVEWVRHTRRCEAADACATRIACECGLVALARWCVRSKASTMLKCIACQHLAKVSLTIWAAQANRDEGMAWQQIRDLHGLATRFWRLRAKFAAFARIVESTQIGRSSRLAFQHIQPRGKYEEAKTQIGYSYNPVY